MWLDLNIRFFKLFTKLKLGLQYKFYPSRTGVLKRRGRDSKSGQKKDWMRHRYGSCLEAKEKSLRRTQTWWHAALDFQVSKQSENKWLLSKPSSLWDFAIVTAANIQEAL